MPQYKRKPTKADNDIFRSMFGIDIPGYVPEMTKADSLAQEKVDIERRLLKGEEPRTIGERAYGEKLKLWEEPEEAKPLSELMGERRAFVGDSLATEVMLGGPEAITPKQLKGLERTGEITAEPRIPFKERMTGELLEKADPEERHNIIMQKLGLDKGLTDSQKLTSCINLLRIYESGVDLTDDNTVFSIREIAKNRPDLSIEEIKKLFSVDRPEIHKEMAELYRNEANRLMKLGVEPESKTLAPPDLLIQK